MQIVKTQKIFYNQNLRIRFVADNESAEYLNLLRKLPDCKWSSHLNSWHSNYINNHIEFLNNAFPASIRFYDASKSPFIERIEEKQEEKKICFIQVLSENFVLLTFPEDIELTSILKNLGGIQDEPGGKSWKIKLESETENELKSYLNKSNYQINYQPVNQTNSISISQQKIINENAEKFRKELTIRNYKKRTIEHYVSFVNKYLFPQGNNSGISKGKINDLIYDMSIRQNYSRSYQNQLINSLKAYYQFVLGIDSSLFDVKRPRRYRSIPVILTRQEVSKILQMITNIKHNTLISTIYMTGITLGETISLRPEDIDRQQMRILIRGNTSKRERKVSLSPGLIEKIDNYLNIYQPKNYLFEGHSQTQYSERSIQKVFKKYVLKAGVTGNVSIHSLRHSFAAHLAEEGAEIKDVQKYLGHANIRSTEVYYKLLECDRNNNKSK